MVMVACARPQIVQPALWLLALHLQLGATGAFWAVFVSETRSAWSPSGCSVAAAGRT
jgi:hypothetical protein